ncbi:MAG: CRP/FNR family cyclic AMP-dependent transcriptional regulator [Pseudoalteromonas rhizosphaerae]|uniref:Cyclic nucleotide-binding domain-containing protein n=1 Tax=Pseudoalteromonas neustonica TaxID=1840331 RepID=A0ABY3FDW2_9GAMM|nr:MULTISPECIES: cyclic nucleotide-binding domain-containing protein [Pseudoalteromonas]MBB1292848.1 cyclic nucleotide-binding domain-containing protein [Pseudoalteromonas sp. SR41-4]MBB1433835.1 cyclic nucleotide-binding domain-containing protein [Pseudoalteromonas sp. SG43-6]MBB1506494.1 cyclic nucleotide-binding domain-containing protein [Pseudoalteromonas sp. SG41-1]TVU83133.1 cyclic nucleotide-binding domain-containing protein [Pseudoalteromonas neustonica]
MKLIEHIPLIKQMEILNRLSFFREFSLNERQVLLESFSHLYLINKDRFVFKQFDNDKQLYIVLSGAIVVFKHSHLMDLGTIEPGEFIGEGAFINNREHSTSARAKSDTIVLAITSEALIRLPNVIREKIKDRIIEGMSERIAKLSHYLESRG